MDGRSSYDADRGASRNASAKISRLAMPDRNSFFFINDVSLARARHPDKTHDRADGPQDHKQIKESADTQGRRQIN